MANPSSARKILAQHGLQDSERILIRDRPPEICGDHVSMNLVLADDVQNVAAETYLMTHTTNPLLSAPTIRQALARYDEARIQGKADSLFSVNRFQTRFYREDGSPVNHDPKNLLRTQDLEIWYEENSNLYFFSRESFETTQARIGQTPRLFETPKAESFDIDGLEEWSLVEQLCSSKVT
jgi:CMP-N-acetylneuraminic acid synthetase